MASNLTVQNISGPSNGANPDTVFVPTGQKLIGIDQGSIVSPGGVLQVKYEIKTGTQTIAGTNDSSFHDITGLSLSITPTSATSKILVMGKVSTAGPTGQRYGIRIVRDGNPVGIADTGGSRTRGHSGGTGGGGNQLDNELPFNFLDSPNTTSAVTYKIQGWIEATQVLKINRSEADADSYTIIRGVSTITLMEIAG